MKIQISKEDKRRLCARAFFEDNPDQYEDYHEALTEFMSNKVTDSFIDAICRFNVNPEPGFGMFIRDDGHIMSYRFTDDFCQPQTCMTDEECEADQAAFTEISGNFPDLSSLEILEKMGWRRIA